jgi:hypothetical protein
VDCCRRPRSLHGLPSSDRAFELAGSSMTRRACPVTQSAIARALRAAKQEGARFYD